MKSKPSARRPAPAGADVPGGAQPAAARRSAEAELSRLVGVFAPAHAPLVAAARRWLRKRLPAAHEVVYEYRDNFVVSWSPNDRGYEGVVALRGDAGGVRLYVTRGKDLADPAKLLEGSGGQARWLNLDGASTLSSPEVARLIDGAIAGHPVPFPSTGRGSVTVRPTSAQKRRQRR